MVFIICHVGERRQTETGSNVHFKLHACPHPLQSYSACKESPNEVSLLRHMVRKDAFGDPIILQEKVGKTHTLLIHYLYFIKAFEWPQSCLSHALETKDGMGKLAMEMNPCILCHPPHTFIHYIYSSNTL